MNSTPESEIRIIFGMSERSAGKVAGMMAFLEMDKTQIINTALTLLDWYILVYKRIKTGAICWFLKSRN